MSAKESYTAPPRASTPSEWTRAAPALAAWTEKHLVNRHDCYGGYIKDDGKTSQTTHKRKLTLVVIQRHYEGKGTIGLHTTVRDTPEGEGEVSACWSRWLLIDIDRHDDKGDPEANRKFALVLYALAVSLGFRPLLFDSNGRGGYHLLLIFDGPVATEKVYRFAKWLIRSWKEHVGEEPETFPKQVAITASGKGSFGNWARLPGPHHTRPHYTRVWDGKDWLEGTAAVKAILGTAGTPATAIPAEAIDPPLWGQPDAGPHPRFTVRADDGDAYTPGPDDAIQAAEALQALGDDYLDDYDKWLNVGFALRGLGALGLGLWEEWSKGSRGHYEPGACKAKWATMTADGPEGRGITLGSLFYWAIQAGWRAREQPKARPSAKGDGHHEGASTAGPKPSGNGKGHHEVPADPYAGATAEELGIVDADDVELENPEWLWEHRFLMGKINLIAGEGGDGKTTVAILVGSVVTVGGTFPDGKPAGEAGCVVVLAAEDGAGDTIKPRFIAAGGETSNGRLKFLTAQVSIPRKGDTPAMVHPVCLQDIGYWRATFTLLRPRVILIDPLPAYLGRGINDHKNSEVQAALKEFAALAKEFNVCVIAITHTGKSVERKLIHRVIGSVAYTNVSRVVHVTIRDPDDKSIRYLERPKCNLDEPRDALVYHLVPVEFERDGVTYRTTKAVFEAETVAIDAEAMVNPRKDGEPRRERDPRKETLAAEWLHDFLDGKPEGVAQRDVFQAAGEAGHIGTFDKIKRRWSSGTKLYRALDRLPSLEAPRDGRDVERLDLASVSDRYPRIYWRLIDTRNDADDDSGVPF